MKRIVLFEERAGVFLGEALGLGFWSKLDPAGQTHACIFDSESDAYDYVKTWEDQTNTNKIQYIEVEVSTPNKGASVEDCIRAGLPAWNPNYY